MDFTMHIRGSSHTVRIKQAKDVMSLIIPLLCSCAVVIKAVEAHI